MFAQLLRENPKKLTFSLDEMQLSEVKTLKELNASCLSNNRSYLTEGRLI